ncbi:recombinase family protein [Gottfriedia sp. NPDC056225]|uniref:recombinase family protein n=1 Tax=Gottfriedia sp. NPDC056225 TaxID=3345751 RepID=UPI0035DBE718
MKKTEKRTPEEILASAVKVAFYGRVSTSEQRVDSQQKNIVTDYLAQHGQVLGADSEYEDEISAYSKGYEERENFPRLLQDLEDGLFDAVVVSDRDRISRQTSEHFKLRDKLEKLGIPIVIASRNELYQQDDLIRNLIEDSLTKFESDTISNRTKSALRTLRDKQAYLGGRPPFGYRTEKIEEIRKGKRDYRVVGFTPIAEQIEQVKQIFQLYRKHHTLTNIANELERKEGKSETDSKEEKKVWTSNKIKNILLNPIYTGNLVYNRYSEEKGAVFKPIEEWVWYPCKLIADPILPMEEWLYCWHLYTSREKHDRHTNSSFYLNHMLRCHCGEKMLGKDQRTNQKGKSGVYGYRYYICQNQTCREKIMADELHYMVIGKVFHHCLTPTYVGEIVKANLQQELYEKRKSIETLSQVIHEEEAFLISLNRLQSKVETKDILLHDSSNPQALAYLISKRLSEERIEQGRRMTKRLQKDEEIIKKLVDDHDKLEKQMRAFTEKPHWTKLSHYEIRKLLLIAVVSCRLTASNRVSLTLRKEEEEEIDVKGLK